MDGKIDGIVDGGPCAVGVESTILDLTVQPPQLLRPGGLPLEALERVAGRGDVDKAVTAARWADGEQPKSPGHEVPPLRPGGSGDRGHRNPGQVCAVHPFPGGRGLSGVVCYDEFSAAVRSLYCPAAWLHATIPTGAGAAGV